MKKLFTLIFVLLCLLSLFFFVKKNIEHNTLLFQKFRSITPQVIKNNIRYFLNELSISFVEKENFKFTYTKNIESNLIDFNYKIKLYNNSSLIFTGPRAYFASNDQELFLVTGNGILMSVKFKDLKLELNEVIFKKLETNLSDFLFGHKYKTTLNSAVKSILIENNFLYLSLITATHQKTNIIHESNDCFKHEILKANLNSKYISFESFFKISDCRPVFHNYVGGTLGKFKKNLILYTVGDFAVCEHPSYISLNNFSYCKKNNAQMMSSKLGKIFQINTQNAEANIISLGHDNPQGIYYDEKNDVIFSTEHGPQGGDEININIFPSKANIKNYGYPISSYGEHYGDSTKNKFLYKLAPLYKSHVDYGFVEPIKYFVPSIGISAIQKIKNKLFIGSLGDKIDEGDLSIHIFDVDDDYKLKNHKVFKVYERVRDLHYVKKINYLFCYLETTGSIGIIKLEEQN